MLTKIIPPCWPYIYTTLYFSAPNGKWAEGMCPVPLKTIDRCSSMLLLSLKAWGRWWPGSQKSRCWKIAGWRRTLPLWLKHPARTVNMSKRSLYFILVLFLMIEVTKWKNSSLNSSGSDKIKEPSNRGMYTLYKKSCTRGCQEGELEKWPRGRGPRKSCMGDFKAVHIQR